MARELPTQDQVDTAVADALHKLGYYHPEVDKEQLAELIANALPGRVQRLACGVDSHY